MKLSRISFAALVALGVAVASVRPTQAQLFDPPTPPPPPLLSFFFTHYYDVATSNSPSASGYGGHGASGGVGDGLVRIVNTSNIFNAPPNLNQNGTICAMIYVFDDIEEMQACCGCPVTPDGLRTMSVINNLTKNFGVNRGNLNAGVIDIFATSPNLKPGKAPLPPQINPLGSSGLACDPSAQFGPTIGVTSENTAPAYGLRAYMTNNEGNVPVPASPALVKGVSVDEFQNAPTYSPSGAIDEAHILNLVDFCFFLITNGSGTGACSCGSGDSFSRAHSPTPADTVRQ